MLLLLLRINNYIKGCEADNFFFIYHIYEAILYRMDGGEYKK